MEQLLTALKTIADSSLENDKALLKLNQAIIERLLIVEKKVDELERIAYNRDE